MTEPTEQRKKKLGVTNQQKIEWGCKMIKITATVNYSDIV